MADKSDRPIRYCQEFYTVKFRGKNMKDAYLRACKWYATNVLSKDELQDVQVKYEKDEQSPTVTLHLFATLDENTVRFEHCNICKEVHKSFLCNETLHCSDCKLGGYQKRVDQKIEVKRLYYRELIERNWS